MSYQDFGDDTSNMRAGGSAVPAWASRANEPLVPSIDIAAIKKSVNADLKELRKAADLLAKLGAGAKKRPENGQTVGPQLLAISGAARERARATSRTLREALGIAQEGTSEHRALTALSDEFKQALIKFQQQVEATTHLVPPATPQEDVETGGGTLACWDGGASASSSGGAGGSSDLQTMDDAAREQQMAQVATNEAILVEREQGISHLSRSVQQVADIFQDLSLLVTEQGTHIDNIQTNIETAHTNTIKGTRELSRASQVQRKTRSRMCIMAICVLAVLIVLVLVLKLGMHALR